MPLVVTLLWVALVTALWVGVVAGVWLLVAVTDEYPSEAPVPPDE